jgi:hypothetical protein
VRAVAPDRTRKFLREMVMTVLLVPDVVVR